MILIIYENSINKIRVEAYTLYEFIQETGEVQATGATLCLDNAFFCQNMGGNYLAFFDKADVIEPLTDEQLINIREMNKDLEGIVFSESLVDTTPSDVNEAATPPAEAVVAPSTDEDKVAMDIVAPTEDGIPFTPEQDAALAQAPAVTPEQVENVNRRRGRPPRN